MLVMEGTMSMYVCMCVCMQSVCTETHAWPMFIPGLWIPLRIPESVRKRNMQYDGDEGED